MAEYRQTSVKVVASHRLRFGDFRFDPGTGRLWHDKQEVSLTPRAAALLLVLAERATEVVTKQELIALVWNRKAVGDDALTSCVQELRRAFGDDARRPRILETRHGRGYRMLLPVTQEPASSEAESLPTQSLVAKPSLAVMPFDNLTSDPGRNYFADGIVDDMTTALSRIRAFFVVSRGSSFTFRGRNLPVQEIGRQLGVRYIVEGSVRHAG